MRVKTKEGQGQINPNLPHSRPDILPERYMNQENLLNNQLILIDEVIICYLISIIQGHIC